MTKTELLSTYTKDRLAEMVVELQVAAGLRYDKIQMLKWEVLNLENMIGGLREIIGTYKKGILPRCTKQAKEAIDNDCFEKVMVVTRGEWNDKPGKEENQPDIRKFEAKIDELQSEVEKYRKAFEDAKKERDCRIAEYQKKIEELYYSLRTLEGNLKVSNVVIEETIKKENGEKSNTVKFDSIKQFAEYIKCFYIVNLDYIQDVLQGQEQKQSITKNIADFLPTEPIKVADILIHNYKQGLYPVYAKDNNGQIQNIEVDGKIYPLETGEYEEYSELRQIAEYLLVYCNHNGEAEE